MLQPFNQLVERFLRQRYLAQDGQRTLSSQAVEVLFAGNDDKSRHVYGTRRGKHLTITIGTVLGTGEHHREVFVVLTPGHDVHHRFL